MTREYHLSAKARAALVARNKAGSTFWIEDRVETLLRMREHDGASPEAIAAALGHGCTRNAVIGKLWRLRQPPGELARRRAARRAA